MTYEETKELLRQMFGYYPGTKIRNAQEMVSNYYTILGKYDLEEILKATRLCLQECSFFPKPADIIKRIHKANLMYDDTPVAPVKQIEASTQPYIDERVEYIMEHFCEGGDCGWDGVNYANT